MLQSFHQSNFSSNWFLSLNIFYLFFFINFQCNFSIIFSVHSYSYNCVGTLTYLFPQYVIIQIMLIRENNFFLLRLLLNTLIIVWFRRKWSAFFFILWSFFSIFILVCFYFNNIWSNLDLLISLVNCSRRITLNERFFFILKIFIRYLLCEFLLWLFMLVSFLEVCLQNFNILRRLLFDYILNFYWFFLSTINGLNCFIFFIRINLRLKESIFRMDISGAINWASRWIICADSISRTLRSSHQNIMSCLRFNSILNWRNTNFLNNIPLIILEFLKIKRFSDIILRTVMSIGMNC